MKKRVCFLFLAMSFRLVFSTSVSTNVVIAMVDGEPLSMDNAHMNARPMEDSVFLWVLGIQQNKAFSEFNITVSEGNVSNALASCLSGYDYNRGNELPKRLATALRLVKNNTMTPDDAFEKHLIGFMDVNLWKEHIRSSLTDERIASIENTPPLSSQVNQIKAQIEQRLLTKKLKTGICGGKQNTLEGRYLWEQWCQKQIRQSEVSIYDPDLRAKWFELLDRRDSALQALGKDIDDSRNGKSTDD